MSRARALKQLGLMFGGRSPGIKRMAKRMAKRSDTSKPRKRMMSPHVHPALMKGALPEFKEKYIRKYVKASGEAYKKGMPKNVRGLRATMAYEKRVGTRLRRISAERIKAFHDPRNRISNIKKGQNFRATPQDLEFFGKAFGTNRRPKLRGLRGRRR